MKHGRDCPSPTCSQCAGAKPRIVTSLDGAVLIDGKPAGRGLDQLTPMEQHAYSKRGGKAHGRRRQG